MLYPVYITLFLLAPILIIGLAWCLTIVFRILVPEKPFPLNWENGWIFDEENGSILEFPVGALDIFEAERKKSSSDCPIPYHYTYQRQDAGFPEEWEEDLWIRRN